LMFGGVSAGVEFKHAHAKIRGAVGLADDHPAGDAFDRVAIDAGFLLLGIVNHFHGGVPAFHTLRIGPEAICESYGEGRDLSTLLCNRPRAIACNFIQIEIGIETEIALAGRDADHDFDLDFDFDPEPAALWVGLRNETRHDRIHLILSIFRFNPHEISHTFFLQLFSKAVEKVLYFPFDPAGNMSYISNLYGFMLKMTP
jgi:hypothetical protein